MKQEIEKRYLASLKVERIPSGTDQVKLKDAYGSVPFMVGKLETGAQKVIVLGGLFSLTEIHLLANHLRSHHNLQLRSVEAIDDHRIRVSLEKAKNQRGRRGSAPKSRDKRVKMRF